MALSPQEALTMTDDETRRCGELEEYIDQRIREVGPTSTAEKVSVDFCAEVSRPIQEEIRRRFEEAGWFITISSSIAILMPKEDVKEPTKKRPEGRVSKRA